VATKILKDFSIVVTGGAGFIGSHLCEDLSKNNRVILIDNLLTGKKENVKDLEVQFLEGSVTDLPFLQRSFKDIDFVFHQAALPSVIRSVHDPITSNFHNITGTLNILLAARDRGVKTVVVASSSSVYGDTPTLPKVESMPPNPLSPYATTKLTAEYYAKQFYQLYGLQTVSLRYFNVFGPKQDPASPYTGVITKFFQAALTDKPLIIFGDGEQSRDFTYVKDVVQANIRAALSERAHGEIINIAKGSRISINELGRLIIEITHSGSELVYSDPRPGDVRHSLADIQKAKDLLGYVPEYSLIDGLKETYKWFEEIMNK
jgi:UDP-glucose 4-epimerase